MWLPQTWKGIALYIAFWIMAGYWISGFDLQEGIALWMLLFLGVYSVFTNRRHF